MSNTLSHIDLTAAEVAKLPASIRKKMEAAFGPVDKVSGAWMLVGTQTKQVAALLDHALVRLPAITAMHTAVMQERNIEKLLEIIAADLPHDNVDAELELENAEIRLEYLRDTKLLTAVKVRDLSGRKPNNKSEPASRWKREGKIFAVRKDGIDLYPAFQFADGDPRPVIKDVLKVLPDNLSPWQIAFWFDSGNGWLDGAEPQECLDQPHRLVEAAKQFASPAVG